MEVLSDIFRSMRVEGSVYFCDMLEAPWEKVFSGTRQAGFHMVRRGECRLTVGDRNERLGPGDLVFLGPGIDHVLSSVSQEPGDSPAETLLLCGYFGFADDTVTPLRDLFRQVTIVRDQDLISHPWLRSTFDQLSAEYLAQSPGSELIVNKLTEVALIELVRINFARQDRVPFLKALDDAYVSRALARLHESPALPWTLDSLAQEVGLSRAAFAKRFKSLVGQPMFDYLTDLRIQKAKDLLAGTGMPVYEVASLSGYESELAFVRAFKRRAGQTPRQYRNQ